MSEEREKQEIAFVVGHYDRLCHAMQSGVAAEINLNPAPTEPKHLRVGVNSAMSNHAALVKLLMDKGIITELEYVIAVRDAMLAEVDRYEKHLYEHYGIEVKLA